MIPFYPGEDGSLSSNSNIVLDGSTPHIREIYFAGENDATYQGGDVVQVTFAILRKFTFFSTAFADFCYPFRALATCNRGRLHRCAGCCALKLPEHPTYCVPHQEHARRASPCREVRTPNTTIAIDIFFRVWQSRGPQPPYLSLWKQNKTLGRHTVHHHLSPPLTPYLFPVPLPEDNSTVLRSGYRQRCPGPQAGDRGDRPRSGVGGHDTNYPRRQR